MDDGAEFLAQRIACGKQIASQPWPLEGETVVIAYDWNGPKFYGSEAFLSLVAGEKVMVTYKNREGLLYGNVVDPPSDRTGWFGGKGLTATLEVVVPVPVGPTRPIANVPHGPPGMEESVTAGNGDGAEGEVEAYIARHGIDTSAAQALRELDPETQMQVILSDLTNCRNPSAVLLCRIDRARGAVPQASAMATYKPPPLGVSQARSRSPPRRAAVVPQARLALQNQQPLAQPATPEAVEEFILANSLDEKAAEALRSTTPENQGALIEIELTNCRNPSAVVVSRLQSLGNVTAAATHVESYIEEFALDEKCAAELRSLTPAEQQQVCEARPTNARNPSAVVNSRIQAVRNQMQQSGAVEEYIARNGIDDSVAQNLRGQHPEVQRQIINSDLSNCRNPSAVLLSRIRSAEAQYNATAGPMVAAAQYGAPVGVVPPPPQRPPPQPRPPSLPPRGVQASSNGQVEAFVQRNNIDAEGRQALLALPPNLQQEVMQRGEISSNCRNPSKVLVSRIRQLSATF